MGEWHKHALNESPCTNCQAGWGSISSKMVDGELWTKSESCFETCPRIKEEDRETFFGENIRDAIRSLRR